MGLLSRLRMNVMPSEGTGRDPVITVGTPSLLRVINERTVLERIPGTVANVARQKRALEKELRAAGVSRSRAKAVASERFRGRG